MNQKALGLVFALGVGLLLAWFAYNSVDVPDRGLERAEEEAAVRSAATLLISTITPGSTLEVIDPLRPNRAVGKTYVYPTADGWQVSGYYRRGKDDAWHPWLMQLDARLTLTSLAVQDDSAEVRAIAANDSRVSATP